MNLREEIQYLTTGKTSTKSQENKLMESFVAAFKEDVKEFGLEEATELYSTIYGIEEFKELDEDTFASLSVEALNEDRPRNMTTDSGLKTVIRDNKRRVGGGPEGYAKKLADEARARSVHIPGKTPLGAMAGKEVKLDSGISKDTITRMVVPGKTPSGAMASKEGKLMPKGLLAGIWDKIKGFTAGQFSSIKNIVSTGNWGALLKLPIFKGALAAGGVVAVIAVLKKLFKGKNKITPEQEAQLRAMKK